MANDWNSVRAIALDCLNSTWDMVCWAARSQEDDYDVDCAALHLAAIDTARDTFRRAMEVLQPGFECATDDSKRYSPVFDALALATVGEGARPDFRFGPVHCATAHEAAFELQRMAILWVEDGLNDELDRRGAPDSYVIGINDLHRLSAEQLCGTMRCLEKSDSLQSILTARQLHKLRAWIDREWAAVISDTVTETHETGRRSPNQTTHEQKVERILAKEGIPIEHRSKPIAKNKAAKLLGRSGDEGRAVEWLNKCINEGTISCVKMTRQTFCFDIRDFPTDKHPQLRP